MHRRNIATVFVIVLFLGLFFQYNRSDGFIRLLVNTNNGMVSSDTLKISGTAAKNIARDHFLIIYDPISLESLILRHQVERMLHRQKKETEAVALKNMVNWDKRYDGVIMAIDNLEQMASFKGLRNYLKQGGTACFMFRLLPGKNFQTIAPDLGIQSFGKNINAYGIKMHTDFLFAAKDFVLDSKLYNTVTTQSVLNGRAKCHMTSYQGVPLLWETRIGKGKAIVYNGRGLIEKTNVGILAAMLSQSKSNYIYPIIGVKVFFLDDFPSPEPEGNFAKIYEEMHLSTSQFYRQVWWPTMLMEGARYNVKYTGLIIESYNNRVKPPFHEEKGRKARDNLIIYGRELLKAGGELGIHGYNHQSLAPRGYGQDVLGYRIWESQQDMILALTELKRYIQEVYPDYTIRVYVPPSNVLSPEGKQAIQQVFSDLKIFASLYNGDPEEHAYYQDYIKNEDGTFEIPRVTSGHIITKEMKWDSINVVNAEGVISHFIHPDELFYEESKNLTWREMHQGYRALLQDVHKKYGWLRACTASEAARYMEEYFNLDYRVLENGNGMQIYCWGFQTKAFFILKTEKKIKQYHGCQIERINDQTYLLKIFQPEVRLIFESGEKT